MTGELDSTVGSRRVGEVMLFGRGAECRQIAALLADARRQRSGALVVSGEPGIGKSALCAWATAKSEGMRLLSVTGVESDADVPLAGLSELCAGDPALVDSLPEPQARALDLVLARRDGTDADRLAIGAAVVSVLARLARHGPALVIVDDAHWLDGSSAAALLFAMRRLRNEGVAVLVATRAGSAFDAGLTVLPHLAVGGLEPASARALLAAAHGALPPHVSGTLVDRSGGNPLALLEVPLALSDAQLAGQQAIDDPLPLGPTLLRALLRHVSQLPPQTLHGLLVAAASGTERVQPVVDAAGALGLDRSVLHPAEEAGVLAVAAERFQFRKPLLRSAIYHGAPAPARRAAHAALAAATGGETRAWHLARATVGEDEAVASTLERIGLAARRRGAPAAAASALERAAQLSRPGEPRARRLTEAAREAHLAGRPISALRLLDDALAGSRETAQRADIQHVRGRVLVLQGRADSAYRLLLNEAERVRDIDPGRRAVMLSDACMDCFLSADVPRAVALARDACAAAAAAAPGVRAFAGVILASALVLSGERVEAGAVLDGFLPGLRLADPLTEAGQLVSLAAQCYFWLDRYDVAFELLAGLIGRARAASAAAALIMPLSCRAELELRSGRWSAASADLQEAADLGEEMADSVFAAYPLECLARLAAAAGDARRCHEHAARALRLIDQHHNELGRLYVYSAFGLLELGMGQVEAAIHELEVARDIAERRGLAEPNVVHWQGDLIEAYVRAGQRDAAQDALVALESQAERTGGRWALGVAARCRGLLADDAHHDAYFAAALEHLSAVAAPFEVARAHLCHGERLRRALRRADARQALRRAIAGFDRLGATPWAARAQAELRSTGATPRRRREPWTRDHLTAHELEVALLVAGGASNREAAAALFVSPKTVEFHLARVYRKLGLRTRTELAALSARQGWFDGNQGSTSPRRIA